MNILACALSRMPRRAGSDLHLLDSGQVRTNTYINHLHYTESVLNCLLGESHRFWHTREELRDSRPHNRRDAAGGAEDAANE